jgi:3-oxoadipate CoA-transferase beta subunit
VGAYQGHISGQWILQNVGAAIDHAFFLAFGQRGSDCGGADAIPAVGGAMDLAIGAKQVFVMMTLFAKDGSAKLVPSCTYPLTGLGCVSRVYTDLAVFDIGAHGVTVRGTYGISRTELADRLGVPLHDASGLLHE